MTETDCEVLESLLDDGSDITISRMHEHCGFGFANKICLSIRKGYETPRRLYASTLPAAIKMVSEPGSDPIGDDMSDTPTPEGWNHIGHDTQTALPIYKSEDCSRVRLGSFEYISVATTQSLQAENKAQLEQCCKLVIDAGLSTGHAENNVELMMEVLDQHINAGPNVDKLQAHNKAQAERIAELEAALKKIRYESEEVGVFYATDLGMLRQRIDSVLLAQQPNTEK